MPTSAKDTDSSKNNEFSIYIGPTHEQTLADTCRSLPAATKSEGADEHHEHADESNGIYYFGVGPIVNPIVRQRQNVKVFEERAAILPGFRITFVVGGIANVVEGHGCEVHGIVIRFDSPEGWEAYRDQNAGSNKVLLKNVHPYDEPDKPIRANVFVQDGLDVDNYTPIETPAQERYLKLIAQGLRQYNVDEEYIEYQIMSVPFVPSRKPGDYLKFPCKTKDEKSLPTISFKKYRVTSLLIKISRWKMELVEIETRGMFKAACANAQSDSDGLWRASKIRRQRRDKLRYFMIISFYSFLLT